ncbi:MAG: hypothetical protein ACYTG5_18925, partial [Planctomycetota bacterium]
MFRAFIRVLPLFASLTLFACGGGGGGRSGTGGPAGSEASASLLITHAGAEQVSAFSATIQEFALIRSDGRDTGNLLAVSRKIELLDLQGKSALLQVSEIDPTTYSGARIAFASDSASARDPFGVPVSVTVGTDTLAVDFAAPVVVSQGDAAKIRLHVDVDESLLSAPGGGLIFEPKIEIERQSGEDEGLDELHGRLESKNPAARQFTMRITDEDTNIGLGSIVVAVTNTTIFFDDNGGMTTEETFFNTAVVNDRIETDGALGDDGVFTATSVELEDEDNGVGRIEGTITDLDIPGLTMMLRISEIEKGHVLIVPVLLGLGNPGVIPVDLTTAQVVVEDPIPMTGNLSDLKVGQEVKVRFSAFEQAPFPAIEIEIEDNRPDFEGRITDVTGLPNSLLIHLEPHDPAVLSGRVDSRNTDVEVILDGSERIFLDLPQEPILAANDLLTRLRVNVRGNISGPSSAPSIDASEVRVRPGRLEGTVTSGNQAARTFTAAMTAVDDPFGGAALPDPVLCVLPSDARIKG